MGKRRQRSLGDCCRPRRGGRAGRRRRNRRASQQPARRRAAACRCWAPRRWRRGRPRGGRRRPRRGRTRPRRRRCRRPVVPPCAAGAHTLRLSPRVGCRRGGRLSGGRRCAEAASALFTRASSHAPHHTFTPTHVALALKEAAMRVRLPMYADACMRSACAPTRRLTQSRPHPLCLQLQWCGLCWARRG